MSGFNLMSGNIQRIYREYIRIDFEDGGGHASIGLSHDSCPDSTEEQQIWFSDRIAHTDATAQNIVFILFHH